MVASVVKTFSRIVVCLEDMTRFIRKEWYLIHLMTDISVLIAMGPFYSTGAE